MKCKVSEMSGDELARSTGQHKQDDHLVPTEHDTSIDESGIKKKHRIRNGFSAFKKKLFPRTKSPAAVVPVAGNNGSTYQRRCVDDFSSTGVGGTGDPVSSRMYKSTGDVLLEDKEELEIARSELSQSADSIYPIPNNNAKQTFEAASSLDEMDINSELRQRLQNDNSQKPSSRNMPTNNAFDSLFSDRHCPLDNSAAKQRISIRPKRRKPTNKRLLAINNSKDTPPLLPKRPILVPKAEISRKIHGLDTYDLSPTVAAPRKRPPSASEWPAMTLPTRVATPTTDTAESDDDTDSDNDETVAPEPTFKPIAAVRTNSPLTKTFAPELPSPKPLGVSVESLPQPQPLSQSQPQPKPLSKPVPVSRRISGSSKSPPTRRQHIDTTLSPLEDTPLHDRQKNAFADFFSKKKTPEEEKASVDLLLPKTTNIDQNKESQVELNTALLHRSGNISINPHPVDRNRRQTVPLPTAGADNRPTTPVKRAASQGCRTSTTDPTGMTAVCETTQFPPPKPLLKHAAIDSHLVLDKPTPIIPTKPIEKSVKPTSVSTKQVVDKSPTPAKLLSPERSPTKKLLNKFSTETSVPNAAGNGVPEWAALARKKTSKFEGNAALNRQTSTESPNSAAATIESNVRASMAPAVLRTKSNKSTTESINARFSMFENPSASPVTSNSKSIDSKPLFPNKFSSPVHKDPLPKPIALRKMSRNLIPDSTQPSSANIKPIIKNVGLANMVKQSNNSPVESKSTKTFNESNVSPIHSIEFSANTKLPTSPTRAFTKYSTKKTVAESSEPVSKFASKNSNPKFTQNQQPIASRFSQNTVSNVPRLQSPKVVPKASVPVVNLRKTLPEKKIKRSTEIINEHANKRKSRVLDIVRNLQNPQVADA